MRARFQHVAAALLCAVPALAQGPAPRETVTATVAGKKVSVEYGRPSLRGRPMSELIAQLPEDRIWRAGVDAVTTFTTSQKESAKLAAGSQRCPGIVERTSTAGSWSVSMRSSSMREAVKNGRSAIRRGTTHMLRGASPAWCPP